MNRSLLDQLKEMTVVVADTGDIRAIGTFKPRDATTNPSLITAAASMPQYQSIVDDGLRAARRELGSDASLRQVVSLAVDRLAIAFGLRILEIIPGRVSTEVDARLSYDTGKTLAKARQIIAQYEAAGVGRKRVLIKIASTWEGITAAGELEREGIHCNLTLLFGMHQAMACADAGVTLISPFVGRILDWYKKETGRSSYAPDEDPGVLSVTQIYNYYKKFGFRTEVMGASFRNMREITELSGCDLLTISPPLMEELQNTRGPLPRRLDPEHARYSDFSKQTLDQAGFERMHQENRMAREKLAEGITGFSKALETLEKLLEARLARLEGKQMLAHAAKDIFLVYDMDGDGLITREEWCGADAVFDALDLDRDGCITPSELATGLGVL